MELINRLFQSFRRRIWIEKPAIQTDEDDQRWQDIRRFSKMIPSEANPHLGRAQEIKEEIKSGHYPTREMIDAAAARLASRLLKPSHADEQQ